MNTKDFSYQFTSSKSAHEIFPVLLDVYQWWNGLSDEEIRGESHKVGDIFTFTAGNGVHFSEQKLIEIQPDKKIVWSIIRSNLSFLKQPNEWEETAFEFQLKENDNVTNVTFTHCGLFPENECYDSCSNGWTQYLMKLEKSLK